MQRWLALAWRLLLVSALMMVPLARADIATINRVPYIATADLQRTVATGTAPTFTFYVTDFDNKDYMYSDTSESFEVSLWLDGALYVTGTYKAGEHTITLPTMNTPTDEVRLAVQAKDSQNRKSGMLFQRFRVVDPAAQVIPPAQIYTPSAQTLQTNFGVYNDNTNPASTTTGLTTMLQWAATNGYRKVVLASGTYSIDAASTVMMPTRMTLDMNGATFKLNPTSLGSSVMVEIANCFDSHLVNGTIEGDVVDHDYSVDSYSEFLLGTRMTLGAEYCSFENLTVKSITGYGTTTSILNRAGLSYSSDSLKSVGAFTAGQINETTGVFEASTDRVATAAAVDISAFMNSYGFIQLGKYLGYQGNPMDNWVYRASFYDATDTYISSMNGYLYRRIYPPSNAKKVRFTLFSNMAQASGVLSVFNIRVPYNCDFINIAHKDVRCVGTVPSGFMNLLITGCTWENCGWAAGRAAFDSEDGWDGSQDLVFRGNTFLTNPGSEFLGLSGHNFLLENNTMAVSFSPRCGSITIRNNICKTGDFSFGPFSRSAYPRVYDNTFSGIVRLSTSYNGVNDIDREYCIRENTLNAGLWAQGGYDRSVTLKMYAYLCDIPGGTVNAHAVDCTLDNVVTISTYPTKWFQLDGCTVTNSSLLASAVGNYGAIIDSSLTNTHLSVQNSSMRLIRNTLVDVDCGISANYNHEQNWWAEGNDITTSLPYFLTVGNNFNTVSLYNNTINSSAAGFHAVRLQNPNTSGTTTTASQYVTVSGNTFTAVSGTAVNANAVPKSNVTLTLGFSDNTYGNMVQNSSNLNGLSNVPFVTPPTVSLTSPVNGTNFLPTATIVLSATATDPDGSVAKVEFYEGDTKIGESTTAPYTLSLSNLPEGAYTFTARATDNVGALAVSPASHVTVSVPKEILFVASSTSLSGFDVPLRDRLLAQGYTVTVKGAAQVVASDLNGKDLIIIAGSVTPSTLGSMYRLSTVPIFTWLYSYYGTLGMTGTTSYTDYGANGGVMNINVTNTGHPIAAGLSGTIALTTTNYTQSWAIPGTGATTIALKAGAPTKSALFVYEAGATMVGLNAPARRVGFPMVHGATLSADGYKLFDAGVAWAMGFY